MKLVLMGNPNVGKSSLFNRLTGTSVTVANYAGTTVEVSRGESHPGGIKAEILDAPGTYSLEPTSPAEETASEIARSVGPEDIIVNVVDARNLERGMNLTLQLLKLRRRTVVALNFWDETAHTGIEINVSALESALGVPCVPTVAISGEGVGSLAEAIPRAAISRIEFNDSERWKEVGRLVEGVQRVVHRHHTLADRLSDAALQPYSGAGIAFAALAASFGIVYVVGEGLGRLLLDPLFARLWAPLVRQLSSLLGGEGFLHDVMLGQLGEGTLDFMSAFGLLTTGLYVPFAVVLPYILAFYLVLSLLEDTGYLPRLAVFADGIMHRFGMHGMVIIPMLLGLGCNVPGIMAARVLEGKRERFIAITIIAVAVPCISQMAMVVGLAGRHGPMVLVQVAVILAAVWLALGRILNRAMGGESPELLLDIPPYSLPNPLDLGKKMLMRLRQFMLEAVPWLLAGVALVCVMSAVGLLGWMARLLSPVMGFLFGLPGEAAGSLVVSFLRKDVAVGMLATLSLTAEQTTVACVVLSTFFPCAGVFAVLLRELGGRDTARALGIMILTSLLAGSLTHLILSPF